MSVRRIDPSKYYLPCFVLKRTNKAFYSRKDCFVLIEMAIILRKFQHQSGPTTQKKPQIVSANMEDAVKKFQCVNFHGTYCIMRLDQTDDNDTVTRPKKKYPGGPLAPQEKRRMDPT
jgi:hypothetical protein